MSKEIYKEYVNKYFFDCESEKDRIALNQQYLYEYSDFSSSFAIYNDSQHPSAFVDLHCLNYGFVKRKPKTQMINGHEVVAPRYYEPKVGDTVYTHNPWHRDGVNETEVANYHKISNIAKGGWFDNKEDALAYANAHRENKND